MQMGTHTYGEPEGGFPDYTDPEDMRRLRAVTSDRGWQPDRDDRDGITLAGLYSRMDDLLARGPQAPYVWDEGDWVALVAEIGHTWDEIRRLTRGN